MAKENRLPPAHPGEHLRDDFMVPLRIGINQLARDLHVPPIRISRIVNQRRGITGDTGLRLARYFGTSPELWMNLQSIYELDVAERANGETITGEVQPVAAAD